MESTIIRRRSQNEAAEETSPGQTNFLKRTRKQIRSVIVIEDQQDNREMLNALLEMEGFDVRTAENGERGLRSILNSPPDAAVIDLGLPYL